MEGQGSNRINEIRQRLEELAAGQKAEPLHVAVPEDQPVDLNTLASQVLLGQRVIMHGVQLKKLYNEAQKRGTFFISEFVAGTGDVVDSVEIEDNDVNTTTHVTLSEQAGNRRYQLQTTNASGAVVTMKTAENLLSEAPFPVNGTMSLSRRHEPIPFMRFDIQASQIQRRPQP